MALFADRPIVLDGRQIDDARDGRLTDRLVPLSLSHITHSRRQELLVATKKKTLNDQEVHVKSLQTLQQQKKSDLSLTAAEGSGSASCAVLSW